MKLCNPSVGGKRFRYGCQSGYKSGDLLSYATPVLEVSGSGPGCHSEYRSGDL